MSEVERLRATVLALNCKDHYSARHNVDALIAAVRAEERERITKSTEFWRDSVYPDGMTAQKVADELSDYRMILHEVSIVYCHVTGGRISKPNALHDAVIGIVEDLQSKEIDEAVVEAIRGMKD